jgi:hypothetical protein
VNERWDTSFLFKGMQPEKLLTNLFPISNDHSKAMGLFFFIEMQLMPHVKLIKNFGIFIIIILCILIVIFSKIQGGGAPSAHMFSVLQQKCPVNKPVY